MPETTFLVFARPLRKAEMACVSFSLKGAGPGYVRPQAVDLAHELKPLKLRLRSTPVSYTHLTLPTTSRV